MNSRLDELQAAVLRARLPLLAAADDQAPGTGGGAIDSLLPASLRTIRERDPGHVYHLFPVLAPERGALQAHLSAAGIETMVHYPVALTKQPAFAAFVSHECPVAAAAAGQLLSLPLSPRLCGRRHRPCRRRRWQPLRKDIVSRESSDYRRRRVHRIPPRRTTAARRPRGGGARQPVHRFHRQHQPSQDRHPASRTRSTR